MRLVHFMVGVLVIAASSACAAPSTDTVSQLTEADAQLARSDVAGAQRTLERIALELTAGAAVSGREARVAVNGLLSAMATATPAESRAQLRETMSTLRPTGDQAKSQGYQMGWRMGYADARAGHYTDHRPSHGDVSHDEFYRGYEEGWSAGNSPTF